MSTKELLELAGKTCVPCKGGISALGSAEIKAYQEKLDSGWHVINNHHLEKEFKFDDYEAAIDFANMVANIAIEQDHHPDILLAYGKVTVIVWTHKAGGLTENDFVLAAKVEKAIARLQEYRAALITAAVTGKIDVRGEVGAEKPLVYPEQQSEQLLAAEKSSLNGNNNY